MTDESDFVNTNSFTYLWVDESDKPVRIRKGLVRRRRAGQSRWIGHKVEAVYDYDRVLSAEEIRKMSMNDFASWELRE